MRRYYRALGVLAVLALAATASRAADDYEVKLERPFKVGDKYSISATGSMKQSMAQTMNGKANPAKTQELKAALDAKVEVAEVDATGRALKLNITVEKCTVTEDGAEQEAVAPGKVLIKAVVAGKTSVTLKDGVLKPMHDAALETVTPSVAVATGDDEIFATKGRRKVGESWPANSALMAADLIKGGLMVKAESLSGSTKLVAVRDVGGQPCMEISASIDGKDLSAPNVPQGVKVTEGTAKGTMSGVFPVDLTKHRLSEASKMAIHFVMEAGPMVLDTRQERSAQITYKY